MQKVITRIKEVRRPISDETIGFRLQAAYPNQAGRVMLPIKKKGELAGFKPTARSTTAFTREYLAFETGDMTDPDVRDLERFKQSLREMGFTHMQWGDDGQSIEL